MIDSQDQAIVDAIRNGVAVDEIKAQFGVDDAKIEQLRPVAEEAGETAEAPQVETPAEVPAEEAGESQEAGDAPAEEAPADAENAPAEAPAEEPAETENA